MTKLTKIEIENILSKETGHSTQVISEILASLSSLAYKEAVNGFTLPGFGEFSIHSEPDKIMLSPFTKQEILIQGKREIKFTFDTTAEDSFLESSSRTKTPEKNVNSPLKPAVLPQIKLMPDKHDVVAAGLNYKRVMGVSNIKLGGTPDWLQGEQHPKCCGADMLFYGQFDSAIGGIFNLADAGMLYVFWCKHCYKAKTVFQFC